MKRKTSITLVTAINKYFPSVILFKSGIEELVDILQQEGPRSITIQDTEYEYDSVDELLTKYQGREIRFLRILAFYSEPVMVTIGRGGAHFFSQQTTPHVMAVLLRVKQFFKVHERQASLYLFNPFLYFMTLAGMIFLITRATHFKIGTLIALGLPIFTIACLIFYHHRLGGFSRIFAMDRHERDTFLTRNKDTIWVGVIVGIVTAFVTWLITYLTTSK